MGVVTLFDLSLAPHCAAKVSPKNVREKNISLTSLDFGHPHIGTGSVLIAPARTVQDISAPDTWSVV